MIDPEQSPQESRESKESRLGRFFQRIQQLFNPPLQVDIKLHGRIQEMHARADLVLLDLHNVKNNIETLLAPNYAVLVNTAIDPLIKEINRTRALLVDTENATGRVKAVRRYTELLEKAQIWTNVTIDPLSVHQALLHHTVVEFCGNIDRDIYLIGDYLDHALDGLTIASETKSILRASIEPQLSKFIDQLNELKTAPGDLIQEGASEWRMKVNDMRSKYFSHALHVIDGFIDEFIPERSSSNEDE